jgi:alpha-1,3-rhamnosyl/mannosyltransferase
MRILIDGSALLLRSGGVKNYLHYWLLHLRKLAGPDAIRIFPFISEPGELHHEHSAMGPVGTFARLRFLQWANRGGSVIVDLLGKRVDLFHSANVQVLFPPATTRFSATIHDMTCWILPDTHMPANVAATRSFGEMAARRADGFIAVSGSTRDDAVRILGLRPDKVRVIHPGVADSFFAVDPESIRPVRQRYGLDRAYVLFVGTIEPRKNLELLLDAYEQLPSSVKEEFELVVAGPAGWKGRAVTDRMYENRHIRYLGYVPEADLPALTAGASVFAYVSRYEGFGLPVAQAMAAGVPVVTSNVSSLPEVAGDAAVLVDPRSVAEARAALYELLVSPDRRERLAALGRERVESFRWERCARESLDFFREVIGN